MDDSKSKTGFQRAAQDLIDDGYTVESLNLSDKDSLPKDATTLVIAGARDRFLPNEVQTIHAWLKRGGRVFFLLEAGIENGLEAIFRPFGVDVGDNLIIDPNPASRALGFSRGDAPIVNRFEQHPITNPLQGTTVLFYWVRSVALGWDLRELRPLPLFKPVKPVGEKRSTLLKRKSNLTRKTFQDRFQSR